MGTHPDPFAAKPPPGGWLGRLAWRWLEALQNWARDEHERRNDAWDMAYTLLPADLDQCQMYDFCKDGPQAAVRKYAAEIGASPRAVRDALEMIHYADLGPRYAESARRRSTNPYSGVVPNPSAADEAGTGK